MTIYCNVTDCVFRDELKKPHKRDSLIPALYTGVCSLPGVDMQKIDALSPGRIRRVEAVCNTYSTVETDATYVMEDIICDMKECFSNEDGICNRAEKNRNPDIYVSKEVVYEKNEKKEYPICSSKNRTLQDLGRMDFSRYPKR